ncbi:hypothetical protein Avbf_00013 [Armadillidium vulgare]|nr:hypothetical protein Avbf_00013 [Armadillidium vulgare]
MSNLENGFTIQIVTDITPKRRKKNTLLSSPFDYTMIDLLNVLSGWRAKIVLKKMVSPSNVTDITPESRKKNTLLSSPFDYTMIDLLNC